MSKKDEKVNEDVKIDVVIDVEADDEYSTSADQDDLPDDSGKILHNHYSYYDIIHTCWREMRDYVVTRQLPLCEHMTIYNFVDFVDNV
jgi:hypothetical protein